MGTMYGTAWRMVTINLFSHLAFSIHRSGGPTSSHIILPGPDSRGRRHDDCQGHEHMGEARGTHLDEFSEIVLMSVTAGREIAQIMIKSSDLGRGSRIGCGENVPLICTERIDWVQKKETGRLVDIKCDCDDAMFCELYDVGHGPKLLITGSCRIGV